MVWFNMLWACALREGNQTSPIQIRIQSTAIGVRCRGRGSGKQGRSSVQARQEGMTKSFDGSWPFVHINRQQVQQEIFELLINDCVLLVEAEDSICCSVFFVRLHHAVLARIRVVARVPNEIENQNLVRSW